MARGLTGDARDRSTWAPGLLALALLVLGAVAFDRGLDLRAEVEPPQLVVLQGDRLFRDLSPGREPGSELAAEIRARPLTSPAPELRRVGAPWRHVGVGLLLAGVAAAFLGGAAVRRNRSPAAWTLRVVWSVPCLYGTAELIRSAGAAAPSAALARDAFTGALPMIVLGVVLLLAWRG